MLVLTRKLGERIILAGDIVITVVEVNGRAVRLGIEAPREVAVLREELVRSGLPRSQSLASGNR